MKQGDENYALPSSIEQPSDQARYRNDRGGKVGHIPPRFVTPLVTNRRPGQGKMPECPDSAEDDARRERRVIPLEEGQHVSAPANLLEGHEENHEDDNSADRLRRANSHAPRRVCEKGHSCDRNTANREREQDCRGIPRKGNFPTSEPTAQCR